MTTIKHAIRTGMKGCMLAAAGLILTACGGGGGASDTASAVQNTSTTNARTVTITGTAVKGTLRNATVNLYMIDDVAGLRAPDYSRPIATTQTDRQGQFTFTLNESLNSDLMIEVAANPETQMVCDDIDGCATADGMAAFGTAIPAPANLKITGVRQKTQTTPVSVSLISHLIASKATKSQMGLTPEALAEARSALAAALNVNPDVIEAPVVDVTSPATADAKIVQASILNAALASQADANTDFAKLAESLSEDFTTRGTLSNVDAVRLKAAEVTTKVAETHNDAITPDIIDWALASVDTTGTDTTTPDTSTTTGSDTVADNGNTGTTTTSTDTTTPDTSTTTGTGTTNPDTSTTTGGDTVADNGNTGTTTGSDTTSGAGSTSGGSSVDNSDTTTPSTEPAIEPVSISLAPVSQSAGYGSDVTLNVSATGTGPLTYQWKKDGVEIAGANQATLTLTQITRDAAGAYSVVVTNAAGSVETAPATLSVIVDTTATLTWTIPDTRVDGTALPLSEIDHYNIYQGTDPNNLTKVLEVTDATQTIQQFTELNTGTWYFAVSVVDTYGIESDLSDPKSKQIF